MGGLGNAVSSPPQKHCPKKCSRLLISPLIQYAVEEAVAAGIEEFIFVTGRNKTAIEDHFDHSTELETTLVARGKLEALNLVQGMIHSPGSVSYVRQQEAAGLGHRYLVRPSSDSQRASCYLAR